MIVYKHYASVK